MAALGTRFISVSIIIWLHTWNRPLSISLPLSLWSFGVKMVQILQSILFFCQSSILSSFWPTLWSCYWIHYFRFSIIKMGTKILNNDRKKVCNNLKLSFTLKRKGYFRVNKRNEQKKSVTNLFFFLIWFDEE